MNRIETRTFSSTIQSEEGFIFIAIPFAPRDVWGSQPRYPVTGAINGYPVHGTLGALRKDYFLRLSKKWLNANQIEVGSEVVVELGLDVKNA